MTGQSHPTQPWPAAHQPYPAQPWPAAHQSRGFPPGAWAPPVGQGHPAPGPWSTTRFAPSHPSAVQLPTGPAQFPAGPAQFPAGPGFGGAPLGHWAGHPQPIPMPNPVRPSAPERRRQGPVAMVSVLLLVLLVAGAAAWAVSSGRAPGTVGASSGSPLAAPSRAANPLPANPIAAAGAGDFCRIARDTVARQGAALNDPNADLTAMLAEARATNQRLAAAAPAELRSDFAVFQQVSDQMVDALNGGDPQSLQGVMTPQFLAAVEHITGYAKTRCGIQLDSLAPPGLGG